MHETARVLQMNGVNISMSYKIIERKLLPKSQIELALEIDAAAIRSECEYVLEAAAKEAEMDGFRRGKVPKEIVRKRTGELVLWEEAALHALSEALAEIFRKETMDVIGRPDIAVTKLAPENPAGFRVTVSLLPTLSLPDYREIAAEENSRPEDAVAVEEKEIDAIIEEIKRQRAEATGKKDFALSDENAKELGAFETVAQLRSTVKKGVLAHKKIRAKEKRRAELLDRIARGARGELPEILVENELSRMEAELTGEIERLGATLEKYLAETKKTKEELLRSWKPDAEKRARLQLALAEIARVEKIIAPPEEIETEVKHILEHYGDAKPENARLFMENMILIRKTIEFLEHQR